MGHGYRQVRNRGHQDAHVVVVRLGDKQADAEGRDSHGAIQAGCDGGDDSGLVDEADVAAVGNHEIAVEIHRDSSRVPQLGAGGEAAVAGVSVGAVAGDGGDGPGGIDHDDTRITQVRNVEIAARVERQPGWIGQLGRGAGHEGGGPMRVDFADEIAVGYVEVAGRVDGHRGGSAGRRGQFGADGACGVDLAHLAEIAEVDVTAGVDGHARRREQMSAGGRAAVAGIPDDSIARHGGYDSSRGHFADARVAGVGDEKIAGGIERDAGDRAQHSAGGRSAIARIAPAGDAGNGGDDSGSVHFSDAEVGTVGDPEHAARVRRGVLGRGQDGAGGQAAVSAEAERAGTAGNRGEDALGVHFANAVGERVGDVEVPCGVGAQTALRTNPGARGRRSIGGEGDGAVARRDGDDALRIDAIDVVERGIGDIEVPRAIHR